ncbi:hypothetical protein ACH5RR_013318 [Cinchona calisaya]|uniref:Uncharacterized protein n=1 Tax=Cinchona calisaya TaxID=153742 RepID=A0ABD2ZZQ7_9GENT
MREIRCDIGDRRFGEDNFPTNFGRESRNLEGVVKGTIFARGFSGEVVSQKWERWMVLIEQGDRSDGQTFGVRTMKHPKEEPVHPIFFRTMVRVRKNSREFDE